jgi:hypothetical protein
MPILRSKLATATTSSTVATDAPKISSVAWASPSAPSSEEPLDSLHHR